MSNEAFAAKPIAVKFKRGSAYSELFDLRFSRLFGVTYPAVTLPAGVLTMEVHRSHEPDGVFHKLIMDDGKLWECAMQTDAHAIFRYPAPTFGLREGRFKIANAGTGAAINATDDFEISLLVME